MEMMKLNNKEAEKLGHTIFGHILDVLDEVPKGSRVELDLWEKGLVISQDSVRELWLTHKQVQRLHKQFGEYLADISKLQGRKK